MTAGWKSVCWQAVRKETLIGSKLPVRRIRPRACDPGRFVIPAEAGIQEGEAGICPDPAVIPAQAGIQEGEAGHFVIPAKAGIREGEAGMRDGFRRRFFSRCGLYCHAGWAGMYS